MIVAVSMPSMLTGNSISMRMCFAETKTTRRLAVLEVMTR
jgi:hypothetical protein